MGDADDLYESGLMWGWADEDGDVILPDFDDSNGRYLRGKNRWMARSRKRRSEVSNQSAQIIARQLVQVKEQIRKLQNEEKQLKEDLGQFMPIAGWIKIKESNHDYVVEKLTIRSRLRLRTRKTMRFIASHYGKDAALLVAENCAAKSRKNTAIYVRPFKSEHDAGDDDQGGFF